MSAPKRITEENERLRLLVEELKRENRGLTRSVEMSREMSEFFMAKHQATIEDAQRQISDLEHMLHCENCRTNAGFGEQGMEFPKVAPEGNTWGAN